MKRNLDYTQIRKKRKLNQNGKGFFDLDYNLPLEARNIVQQLGDKRVIRLEILRSPLNSAVKTAANVLTLGGVSKIENDLQSRLYHLFSFLTLEDGTRLLLEKNDRINLSKKLIPRTTATESIRTPVTQNLSLRALLDSVKNRMGQENFYTYDALKNNCQDFLLNVVSCLSNPSADVVQFIKQSINTPINSVSSSLLKGVTNLGGWFNNLKDKAIGYFNPKYGIGLKLKRIKMFK